MAREYPRFLFSNPGNTKSKGPFIVHTLEPKFIARVAIVPNYEKIRCIHDGKYVLFILDEYEYSEELEKATDAAFKWIHAQVKGGLIVI